MQAFHNDIKIKQKYIKRVDAHIKADKLIRGQGWANGKGCAVGCTLENYEHKQYETELGIPEWLARVEDTLFEGMNEEKSKTWPKVFLKVIPVGADLEQARVPFLLLVLEQNLSTLCSLDVGLEFKDVIASIEQTKSATIQVMEALENGGDLSAAASAASARSASWSAESAARLASWSAESAESVAESAARLASWSAAESARSAAESAARSISWSAESAARSASWSAESAAFDYYADELIELLKNAAIGKVGEG